MPFCQTKGCSPKDAVGVLDLWARLSAVAVVAMTSSTLAVESRAGQRHVRKTAKTYGRVTLPRAARSRLAGLR
jgi:hypothetical protein